MPAVGTIPIIDLAAQVESLIEGILDTVSEVKMGECADGSRRWYALIETTDGNLDQTFRIITPRPWNAPAWASDYREWIYEVKISDSDWQEMEV